MKKRTREELMEATFRLMYMEGDLEIKHIVIELGTGGTFDKTIFHVKPAKRREDRHEQG